MRAISRFEVNLLRVLHALLQRAPLEPALTLLANPQPRPPCLSRDAVELLQDTLAKGCVQFLARRSWARTRFLRSGTIADGRLWQRTAPAELGLTFSRHSLEFLLRLQSGTFGTDSPAASDLTMGDRLLLLLAFNALRDHAPGHAMARHWLPLHQDGLCRLAFPHELTDDGRRFRIDWLPWTDGVGSCILEAMQGWLAERWVRVERTKADAAMARLRKIGANQQRVYGEFLDALDTSQRRDLAHCFLECANRLLRERPSARKWVGHLDVREVRLADRPAIYADAFALLAQLSRLQTWQQQAVAVGYFDDGYQASQLWKADWERHCGNELCQRASSIMREVQPMS